MYVRLNRQINHQKNERVISFHFQSSNLYFIHSNSKLPKFKPKCRVSPLLLDGPPYFLGEFKTNQLINDLPIIRGIAILFRVFSLILQIEEKAAFPYR